MNLTARRTLFDHVETITIVCYTLWPHCDIKKGRHNRNGDREHQHKLNPILKSHLSDDKNSNSHNH